MNTIEFEANGQKYRVDLDKAVETGIVEKVEEFRDVTVKDIPNGSIFAFQLENSPVEYVMLNNKKTGPGQCVKITKSDDGGRGKKTYFSSKIIPNLRYFDSKSQTWVSKIKV